MLDRFADTADAPFAPATRSFVIVPSDADRLPIAPKAIYVGSGGTLSLQGVGDSAPVIWTGIPSGALIPFRASHVLATGTTATGLIGLS